MRTRFWSLLILYFQIITEKKKRKKTSKDGYSSCENRCIGLKLPLILFGIHVDARTRIKSVASMEERH